MIRILKMEMVAQALALLKMIGTVIHLKSKNILLACAFYLFAQLLKHSIIQMIAVVMATMTNMKSVMKASMMQIVMYTVHHFVN